MVIEPLKELYKDEVRKIGSVLNLPIKLVNRHPFPGPGISINQLCSNGKFNDQIKFNLLEKKIKKINFSNLKFNEKINISLLPVKSVGVQGDLRTYNYPAVIKFNDFFKNFLGWNILEQMSSLISNNVKDINRIVVNMLFS